VDKPGLSLIHSTSVGERSDGKSKGPISNKQQWLVDHVDKYVIRSKVKDEVILYEKGNIKYYCELDVSVNCLELILLGLTTDKASDAEQGINPTGYTKNLKKIVASLVEDVARHAIVIDYPPLDSKHMGEDAPPPHSTHASRVIETDRFTAITEDMELQFVPPFEDEEETICTPKIRLVQSSLRRNIKRRKAKPRYPVYMWILGGSTNKRVIPPRHATDFYYRLLEGKVGYPLNYLGACINDLASQGIIEVIGKRLTMSCEGAELVERLFDCNNGKGVIYWKVRVGRKKSIRNNPKGSRFSECSSLEWKSPAGIKTRE
jgi:hypothetical protein